MNFRTLRYFTSVCDCGGIGRSARRLSVAQSTVSTAVSDLEEELGVSLFKQTPIGLRPTASGVRLRRFAESLLLDVELACLDIFNGRFEPAQALPIMLEGIAEGSAVHRATAEAVQGLAREAGGGRARISFLDAPAEQAGAAQGIVLRYAAACQADTAPPGARHVADTWRLLRLRDEGPGSRVPRNLADLAGLRLIVPNLESGFGAALTAALGGAAPLFVDMEEAGAPFTLLSRKEAALLVPAGLLASGAGARGVEVHDIDAGPADPVLTIRLRSGGAGGRSLLEAIARHAEAVLSRHGDRAPAPSVPRFWLQKRIDRHTLQCFLAVVETGSITRAAAACNLVQPALSMQVRKIETALGHKLLDRTGSGLTLRPAGQRLYDLVQPLLNDATALADLISEPSREAPVVRLGLVPALNEDSLIAEALAEAISTWREAYGTSRLSVAEGYSGVLRRWLRNQLIDAAVIDNIDAEAGFAIEPLIAEPLALIHARSGTDLPDSGPVEAIRARRPDLVMPSRRFGLRLLVDRALAQDGLSVTPGLEVDSLAAIVRLVRMGRCTTILPPSALKRDLREDRLAANEIRNPSIVRRLGLARRHRSPLSAPTRQFIRIFVEAMTRSRSTASAPDDA